MEPALGDGSGACETSQAGALRLLGPWALEAGGVSLGSSEVGHGLDELS